MIFTTDSSHPEDQPVDSKALPETTETAQEGSGDASIPAELAVLPLKGTVIYPNMSVPLVVGRPASRKLIDAVILEESRILGLVMQKDASVENPGPEDLYEIGAAAQILKLLKFPDGNLRVIIKGLSRIRIQRYTATEPFLKARVGVLHDATRPGIETEALVKNITNLLQKIFNHMPIVPEEFSTMLLNVEDPGHLADAVAAVLIKETAEKENVLETLDVRERLEIVMRLLSQELEILEVGSKIQQEVQEEMGKTQKTYILRQQLKAIQKELGEEDESSALIREFEEKIEASGMPEEAKTEAMRELNRLKAMPPAAAEHTVARTYLEWMVDLPWAISTEDKIDLSRARKMLDEDHYDLEKVKERILEYLAVRQLKKDMKGPILCFSGPPGTGKTSLGMSIARAMGRKFRRMSLGGVRDEAEIRGHRRTYIGALPGRIIQALHKVKTNNPVIMLDEIDKLGADFRGDPSSALLEVLDPEQNHSFNDHYMGVSFDLSRVFFIATANILDTIPPPLRDRMEILRLAGYTLLEKVKIARRYLIPRQLRENGLEPSQLSFQKRALESIITGYTREAGVRGLERTIGSISRKVARRLVEGRVRRKKVTIRASSLPEYLGPVQFEKEVAERMSTAGVATGMAWTSTGGEILFIESTAMPGSHTLTLTGQLGDVMKESAQTALSVVRSRSQDLGIAPDFFQKNDLHVHVPAGAIPKDGPSAGVAIATSLASLLTGRPVRAQVALSGEITLRGKVLPVGGIKEKVLAAHRAEITRVILPERNRRDLTEVPAEVRQDLDWVFVRTIEEVWKAALGGGRSTAPENTQDNQALPPKKKTRAAPRRVSPHVAATPGKQ
ncbi:MAG: endopeptidase La [Acidobacteriota bacterium]